MIISIKNEPSKKINDGMMGLFFEDINYAADGGLYAEMLENRSFSFVKAFGEWSDYYTKKAWDYAWTFTSNLGKYDFVSGSSLSTENPDYLRVVLSKPGFTITNKAYEGLSLKKDMTYTCEFWARPVSYKGNFIISLKKDSDVYAESLVDINEYKEEKYNFWKRYSCVLKAKETINECQFNLSLDEGEGTVEFAYISLVPDDAVCGIFRKDLFELLKDMHPGFIRFPGGCIVEGNTLQNRYKYKDSLKDKWDRKTNWNRWAVHDNNKDNNFESKYAWYNQTMGLGFYEYFLLCDMIGAKPLPVLNVGFACQYMSKEMVSRDSEEFTQFVNDALDLIEFANGSVDSYWGSIRAKMGHKEPFNLELIGIGNEQWQTEKADFFERYELFEKAIHEKYPEISLIGSAGPDITSEKYTAAWDFYRKNKDKSNFAYALDEHYYVKPEWLFEHNSFYDNYDRDIKVFSGEYAAHPFSGMNKYDANTLWGALSEAAFLTGVERNADVVVLASYAPLFARVNYAQWSPDMIWFNSDIAYGSPSYHVQKMYASNMGDETLKLTNLQEAINQGIYYALSRNTKTKEIIVKIVNSNAESMHVDLDLCGDYAATYKGDLLTGPHKDAYNYVDSPDNVSTKPVDGNVSEGLMMPAYSFAVIRFNYL